MTTKARLAKLEASTTATSSIDDHAEALVRLLAQTDAVFWPTREIKNAVQVLQMRRRYHSSGIQWSGTSSGGSSRAWKSDARQREAMQQAGLVTIQKSKSNLPRIKLTNEAEQKTRALVGIPTASELTNRFFLDKLSQDDDGSLDFRGFGNVRWWGEPAMFGHTYEERPNSDDWDKDTLMILPMLVSGCIESLFTFVGTVFYRATDKPAPEVVDDLPPVNSDLASRYVDLFFDSLDLLRHSEMDRSDEIIVPLSATR